MKKTNRTWEWRWGSHSRATHLLLPFFPSDLIIHSSSMKASSRRHRDYRAGESRREVVYNTWWDSYSTLMEWNTKQEDGERDLHATCLCQGEVLLLLWPCFIRMHKSILASHLSPRQTQREGSDTRDKGPIQWTAIIPRKVPQNKQVLGEGAGKMQS